MFRAPPPPPTGSAGSRFVGLGPRRPIGVALACVAILLACALPAKRASAQGVAFASVNAPWSEVLAKAKPLGASRLVLVEFFTEHCGLCRALERETFEASDVAAALRDDLCVRYDAEGETGRPVAERFRIRHFPTTLFVDTSGDEVDRVIGFISPSRFVEETTRIRAGTQTLKALRVASLAAPTDVTLQVAYGRKLARAGDVDAARALLEPVADAAAADPAVRPLALLGLAELAHRSNDARAARARLDELMGTYPQAPECADGWLLRVDLELRDGEPEKALRAAAEARRIVRQPGRLAYLEETVATIERKQLEATMLRWGETADAAGDVESLHRAALAALERNMNIGSAVRWAERVANAIPDDPAVLETHAALLFESGSPEKALRVGTRALELASAATDRLRIARQLSTWRAAIDPRPPGLLPAVGSDAIPVAPSGPAGRQAPPVAPPVGPLVPAPVPPREGDSEHPFCPPCPPCPPEPKPPCR